MPKTDTQKITVRLPVCRMRISVAICWVVAPFLTEEQADWLVDKLSDWTVKGAVIR